MFVYRYYNYKDVYNDEHSGWEVGFFYWEYDNTSKQMQQQFNRVKTFTEAMKAAEYVHWLNGGTSYYYDNRSR